MADPHRSAKKQMFVLAEITDTPSLPRDGIEAKIFLKGNNVVLLFNQGGTARYKYLPMDDTTGTWLYSATEPT